VIERGGKDLTEIVVVMLGLAAVLSKLMPMRLIGEKQLQIGRKTIAKEALQIRYSPQVVEAILKRTVVAVVMIR